MVTPCGWLSARAYTRHITGNIILFWCTQSDGADGGGRASEKRHLVKLIETRVVTAKTNHKLVVDLVVYATFVPLDEEMMVGAVRRRAVHARRVEIYRADNGRRADFELVASLFDDPACGVEIFSNNGRHFF